ncbi:hypothetical protein BJ741DRAFT_606780 [Chytriomyces cf. hyalinus JEL632]|nr:hypothetical protein BJ741DRAFT_606780 [Chytriomyces cf. hyalinus JEL632]
MNGKRNFQHLFISQFAQSCGENKLMSVLLAIKRLSEHSTDYTKHTSSHMSTIASLLMLSLLSAAAPTFKFDPSTNAGVSYGSGGPNSVVQKEIHVGSDNKMPTTFGAANLLPLVRTASQVQYNAFAPAATVNSIMSGNSAAVQHAVQRPVQVYMPNQYAPSIPPTSVAVVVVTTAAFIAATATTTTTTVSVKNATTTSILQMSTTTPTVAPAAQFASSSSALASSISTKTTSTSCTSTSTAVAAAITPTQTKTSTSSTTTTQQQQQLIATQQPVYAQPQPVYIQPPPVYAPSNIPQSNYQAPPTVTLTTSSAKPANLIPISSSTTTSSLSSTCTETTKPSQTQAPAFTAPSSVPKSSMQFSTTTRSVASMYIPPVPGFAKSAIKAYTAGVVVPPAAGLLASSGMVVSFSAASVAVACVLMVV